MLEHPAHVALLDAWMRSYKPEELFDANGRLNAELEELAPKGDQADGLQSRTRMGDCCYVISRCRISATMRCRCLSPGAVSACDTQVLGTFLRDVSALNQSDRNFRVFGPDETLSNLLGAVFESTDRQWDASSLSGDEFLARPACARFDAERTSV